MFDLQIKIFAALVWHLIVSHPDLQVTAAKWESMPTSN
jgi:hypothetical protein